MLLKARSCKTRARSSKAPVVRDLFLRADTATGIPGDSVRTMIQQICVHLPSRKSAKVIRRTYFRLTKENGLPGISTLIDGLSRQVSIVVDKDVEKEHTNAEAHLVHGLTTLHQEAPRLALLYAKDDARFPT